MLSHPPGPGELPGAKPGRSIRGSCRPPSPPLPPPLRWAQNQGHRSPRTFHRLARCRAAAGVPSTSLSKPSAWFSWVGWLRARLCVRWCALGGPVDSCSPETSSVSRPSLVRLSSVRVTGRGGGGARSLWWSLREEEEVAGRAPGGAAGSRCGGRRDRLDHLSMRLNFALPRIFTAAHPMVWRQEPGGASGRARVALSYT